MVEGLRDEAVVEGSSHGVGEMVLDCRGDGSASSWRVVSGAAVGETGVGGAGWTGLRIVVGQGREGVKSCSW